MSAFLINSGTLACQLGASIDKRMDAQLMFDGTDYFLRVRNVNELRPVETMVLAKKSDPPALLMGIDFLNKSGHWFIYKVAEVVFWYAKKP